MAGGAAGAADALARFQAENGVANVDADAIYSYDKTDQVPLALPQPQPGARRSRRGLPPHPSGVAFPSIAPARPQLTALVLPAAEACSRFTRASSPLTPERPEACATLLARSPLHPPHRGPRGKDAHVAMPRLLTAGAPAVARQLKRREQKPWATDPRYFKHVKISALALLKMAMHARSGGQIEVMGILQGKLEDNTFVVLDAFALPVEGTESENLSKSHGLPLRRCLRAPPCALGSA